MFKVSVKGVVADKGRYLLRINERDEYELCRLGYEHATFAQVDYDADKRIHVVFDVATHNGCPSPRQTAASRSANQ